MLSDIHFSTRLKAKTLNALTAQATAQQPDYILITGDLVDTLDNIDSDAELRRLTAWFERLASVAPTLVALGNHDFYRTNAGHTHALSKQRHWFAENPARLVDALSNIPNLHLLNNTSYEDKNVYILGFTLSPDYYHFDHDDSSTTIFNPGSENLDIFLSDLKRLDSRLITNLPKRKAKLLLIHSPVYIADPAIEAKLSEFDYTVSGHMHNGVVPPVLNDFWRSDRGLIAPGKHFFPRGARAHITSPYDKHLILGAVTTVQESAKPLTFLNHAFPVYTASLELTHNANYLRKPDIKHQYISFK